MISDTGDVQYNHIAWHARKCRACGLWFVVAYLGFSRSRETLNESILCPTDSYESRVAPIESGCRP